MEKIPNVFSGLMKFACEKKSFDAFFSVNGNVITVIPITDECHKKIIEASYTENRADDKREIWMYGVDEFGRSVAFLKNSGLNHYISAPVSLNTAKFFAPIILRSESPSGIDLSMFDVIEFRGGIVDILYPPSKAIDEKYSEKSLIFRDKNTFEKTVPVCVEGKQFKFIYSVSTEDLSMETGKVSDLREHVHSVVRFQFDELQSVYDIKKYYIYALQLFQFCVGRLNVNFEMRMYLSKNQSKIFVKFQDGFDDYPEDLNIMKVIRFDFLGEKISDVFSLLNDEKRRPHLLFLPKRNKDRWSIKYTDVTDLCVALENEYNFTEPKSSETHREEAKKLTEHLLYCIKKYDCSEYVKNKARAILSGQLKNFRPSLKEKICMLCDEFYADMQEITEPQTKVDLNITKTYSADEFKSKIKEFIELRNRTSHAGIVWNEGIDIFFHLQLLVYFSILKRVGYDIQQIKSILSFIFSDKF